MNVLAKRGIHVSGLCPIDRASGFTAHAVTANPFAIASSGIQCCCVAFGMVSFGTSESPLRYLLIIWFVKRFTRAKDNALRRH